MNAYTYDKAGNRLSKVSSKDGIIATNVYSYDEQNRLTETVAATNGSSAEVHTYFGYDNNGNQISKWVQSVGVSDGENSVTLGELGVNAAGDMALYSYDNFNRLTGILQGNTTIRNAYNGRGQKISRTTDGETRYYVYDGNTVIEELDGQNELKARNVYGRNLISRTTDKPMIMSYNGHGDIVLVRSVSGETLAEYAYDEFGNPLSDGISLQFTIEPVEGAEEKTDYSQEIDNPYRYAGYEYLDSVDLYDLNARYYNPKTARFLSEDPYFNLGNRVIGLYEINVPSVLSIMQANALYAYCGNNPVKFKDINGLDAGEVTKDDPPTENDGYVAPKDGPVWGKDKNGNKGWVDKNGNVWVPVPDGSPQAHGGGHWDVNRPDGKGYVNRYPGGKTRSGSGKEPNFPTIKNSTSTSSIVQNAIGTATVVGSGYLIYLGAKWLVATFLGPVTGGVSYIAAAATP